MGEVCIRKGNLALKVNAKSNLSEIDVPSFPSHPDADVTPWRQECSCTAKPLPPAVGFRTSHQMIRCGRSLDVFRQRDSIMRCPPLLPKGGQRCFRELHEIMRSCMNRHLKFDSISSNIAITRPFSSGGPHIPNYSTASHLSAHIPLIHYHSGAMTLTAWRV